MAKRSQWRAAAAWVQGEDGEVRQHLDKELQRLGSADSFQTLGIDYQASVETVRTAFLVLTKEYHPSRFARRDRDVVRLANEVFLCIKAAYNDLASDVGRERALAKLGRAPTVNAPTASGTPGVATPRRAPTTDPIDDNDDFEQTSTTRPGAVRFKSSAPMRPPKPKPVALPQVKEEIIGGDVKFQRALELCQRHLWAEAREALQALAVEEPQNKQYRAHMHYAWGKEHLALGRTDDAKAEYRRALGVDPEFTRAKHALDAVPEDEKPKQRGFFSRLFRK